MGFQTLFSAVSVVYSDDIRANKITIDQAIDNVWKSYFAKPKVSKSAFLDLCHQYDPDFAPISSKTERQKRADLTKKVRDEYRKMIKAEFYEIDPEIEKQFENKIQRNQRMLFQGLSPDEQRALAQKITGDNKETELAKIYVDRVLNKKDQILALLDMDDAELVENIFEYTNELLLIKEIQQYRDFPYTEDQKKNLQELYDRMTELSGLDTRIFMISSVYYADYPFEQLQIGAEEAEDFRAELGRLAIRSGEKQGRPELKGMDALSGPTVDLVTDYGGLRGFAYGILEDRLTEFVKTYGVTSPKDCVWATEDGRENDHSKIMDCINKRELIFVDIPDVGLKALRSSGRGVTLNKPVEATKEEVLQHMIRVAEKGVNRVDAANPFFLSVFTGSDQYKQMAAQHKAVKEMAKELKFPLGEEEYQAARKAVMDLHVSTAQYLEYKKGQKLELVEGMPVGRTANERMRIAAAQDAVKLAETLDFLLQYQKGDPEAAGYMQRQKNSRLEANADRLKKRGQKSAEVVSTQVATYPEEDRGKTSREELEQNVQKLYEEMPACGPSNAGAAMVNLQGNVTTAVNKLIGFSGMERRLGESTLNWIKGYMAEVVLFDYILRERMGNAQPGNEGNIVAGPVEQALNQKLIGPKKLVESPEFNKFLGKLTPARAEAFLKNGESRRGVFDEVVRGMLAPVKATGMANQPVQPQAQVEMNQAQAQAQPQPEPPKPVAPNTGIPG